MRIAVAATLVVLTLPALADGQTVRRGRIGIGTTAAPTRPQPLPEPAPGISPMRVYRSSRFSSDGYFFGGMMTTTRMVGGTAMPLHTDLAGFGSSIAYRFTSLFSATLDLATSQVAGPFSYNSLEFGGRIHPEREGRRIQPFADLRGTWQMAYYGQPTNELIAGPAISYRDASGMGFGTAAGAGMAYYMTDRFALESEMIYGSSRTTGYGSPGATPPEFRSHAYRLVLGLKYTPQRLVTMDPTHLKNTK